MSEVLKPDDWFARNADWKNPKAFIRTDPAYFASECADAIVNGTLTRRPATAAEDVERAVKRALMDAMGAIAWGHVLKRMVTPQEAMEAIRAALAAMGDAVGEDGWRAELEAAIGHMLNANIELETGRTKRTAIGILDRGMIRARAFLAGEGDGRG